MERTAAVALWVDSTDDCPGIMKQSPLRRPLKHELSMQLVLSFVTITWSGDQPNATPCTGPCAVWVYAAGVQEV